MANFRLLAEPATYEPCDWDLTSDAEGRRHWVSHFFEHYHTLEELIRKQYAPDEDRLERFRGPYLGEFERLHRNPADFGRVTILTLDLIRQRHLEQAGFADPFKHVKELENAAALSFYPRLIGELDGRDDAARLVELIQGVFAGNVFDLGAMATVKQYRDGGLDFFATRASLPRRPWLRDDMDALLARWNGRAWGYRKVLFLADNAGCDFVLGCLPLIREFAARRGAHIVLATNTGPSLNDILADEAEQVLAVARRSDPLLEAALADGRIEIVTTGNNAPLIDLSKVSDELNSAAAGVDLLILEGMGRSVESNRLARFTVDTAKLALLKDPGVAARLGGKLFDIVCTFEPVGAAE